MLERRRTLRDIPARRAFLRAAARYIMWRAGHHAQALEPRALRQLQSEAQHFVRLVRGRRLPR
jgi:hypothetical protein